MAPRKFSEPSILDSRFSISGSRRLRRKGFTLIELIMIIILIAILASIAVPRFVNLGRQADIAATRGALGAIRAGMVMDYASRTLASRGSPKFGNVLYHSWFMELDVPVNEISNSSVAAPAAGTAAQAVTGEAGQTTTENIDGVADIAPASLMGRATAGVGGAGVLCCTGGACVAATAPSVGWIYESEGQFEGIVKPCGDNSSAAGFTDDTADVW